MNKKIYLGDSVYCNTENGMIKLTTENGYGPSNIIYLEFFVMQSLIDYYNAIINNETAS